MTAGERTSVELPDGTQVEQPALFRPPLPGRGERGALTPPPVAPFPGELSDESSLTLAISWFYKVMERRGYAKNTRRNYSKAMGRLLRFFGQSPRLKEISPNDMERFHTWLVDQKWSSKTIEVTITATRTFFGAVQEAKILPYSPAADVYAPKAETTQPRPLHDAQVDALNRAAARMVESDGVLDTLPQLLLSLLLDVGLRLGEAQRLQLDDIDLSVPLRPVIEIHYSEKRHRPKRRKLLGPPHLATLVEAYLAQHKPEPEQTRFFHCARRGLQATITELGKAAGLHEPLTANRLRWTYALNQWRAGIAPETMRARLGLSDLGWRDMAKKLEAMSKRPV